MTPLQCGYVSGALWSALRAGKFSPELAWLDVWRSLSHFVVDRDLDGAAPLPDEFAILRNILCRGLPTLPSFLVEEHLARVTRIVRFERDQRPDGIAAFRNYLDPGASGRVLPQLERSFCVMARDADLEASDGFTLPGFDSTSEREFWSGPLSKFLGPGAMQLAVRQRPLDTIAGPDFTQQLTDFSVAFPGSIDGHPRGLIFEVDGPKHHTAEARRKDARRDKACPEADWAVTYRHRLAPDRSALDPIPDTATGIAQISTHPYLIRLRDNAASPLVPDSLEEQARLLALFPFAVARIQRVLLELVRCGSLSPDAPAWSIVVLDRDGLPGCAQIAAADFSCWLSHLYGLYCPGTQPPAITVTEVGARTDPTAIPESVDAFLDLSVEMRYGVARPTPEWLRPLFDRRIVVRSAYYVHIPRPRLDFGRPLDLQVSNSEAEQHLLFFVRNIFRKVAFKDKQSEIILRALRGESVIALLPTGAGKSLTYQMATFLQNGLALVIDPIRSLMKDQHDNLADLGIDASVFVNSLLDGAVRRANTALMQSGSVKFVFASPERLVISAFRGALREMLEKARVHFAFLVVDEAHCVSEWGHDFRTVYLRLATNAKRHCPCRRVSLPILALTGTASHDVLEDIHVELGYNPRTTAISVRPTSMERRNLSYHVCQIDNMPPVPSNATDRWLTNTVGTTRLSQLPATLDMIAQQSGVSNLETFLRDRCGSGLVFCPHAGRKGGAHGVFATRATIAAAAPSVSDSIGLFCGASSDEDTGSALEDFDPVQVQDDFRRGALRVLACTKAFGMGIDKPDVRFTLHCNVPSSLESFYQEAGRAGRDGDPAQCWILYSGLRAPQWPHTADRTIVQQFHDRSFPGVAPELTKVFEMLDENRTSRLSFVDDLQVFLAARFRCPYTAKVWIRDDQARIYLNHPDHPTARVCIVLDPKGKLHRDQGHHPFPAAVAVLNAAEQWLCDNPPPEGSWHAAACAESCVAPGIEAVLYSSVGTPPPIIYSFDNGRLDDLARLLQQDRTTVKSAFAYAPSADAFADHFRIPPAPNALREQATGIFPLIRRREHTFRAIHRLTILGVVSDYEVDYSGQTITATLCTLDDDAIMGCLRTYITRYAPMDLPKYEAIARDAPQATALRRCLYALTRFVYDRIGTQRQEAIRIMEETTVNGLKDGAAFGEAVTLFFDSQYIPILRPHLKEYDPDFIFDVINEAAGGAARVSHIRGACDRLLPEHPGHVGLHALRAYALALLGSSAFAREEIGLAHRALASSFGWDRARILRYLVRIRDLVAAVNPSAASPFDAAILDDHVQWTRRSILGYS